MPLSCTNHKPSTDSAGANLPNFDQQREQFTDGSLRRCDDNGKLSSKQKFFTSKSCRIMDGSRQPTPNDHVRNTWIRKNWTPKNNRCTIDLRIFYSLHFDSSYDI